MGERRVDVSTAPHLDHALIGPQVLRGPFHHELDDALFHPTDDFVLKNLG
jgi:hypothetical protein